MTPAARSTVKFLIVDDRDENLIALEALLRRDGLEILRAPSGSAALELLLQHEVALALLDVQMPEMDGFALAELMRGSARTRHVPIIFVTADPAEQHRMFRGYDAGAVDFLVKPIDPGILKHKADTFFELYKQRQDLAETLRLNETFTAAVGHDLRNPVQAMLIAAELIRDSASEPSVKGIAERLRTSAKRMSRMIDDLFDLARARHGRGLPIDPQPMDALALARRLVTEHEVTHPERKIELTSDGPTSGEWDPIRLEQVIANLVGNALRHGTPATQVDLILRGSDDLLVLEVHNSGTIAKEILPHLFDPFRSSESKRARSTGLGLGLFIVQQVVLAHDGTIKADSANGRTTFQIRLPRKPGP